MAVSVVSFSFSRAAQPEAQRPTPPGAGFLHRILSPTGLQTPSRVLRASSAGCGFPYHILSPTSLIPNSAGAPRAPSAWCGFPYHILSLTPSDLQLIRAPRVPSAGLSLPHLISNFSGPQLTRGPLRPGVAFPTTSRL